MRTLIENFSNQLEEALHIGEKASLSPAPKPITNILINGMGGSGIGGTIVSELVSQQSKIPVSVNKGYFLPAYVNENTLVIISSYSGNTEETVAALETAIERGAKVVCVSSGGKILELSQQKSIDHITIPTGMPPRAAIAYSMVQMFFILNFFNIIDDSFKADFNKGIELIRAEKENIENEAKNIATVLSGKVAVIYAPFLSEGVATRFRQELNENSKMLGWSSGVPEMNHNEVLGWSAQNSNVGVVFFRNNTDYARISKRIDLSKEVIKNYTPHIVEIHSKGSSLIERTIYHIHIGDWVSLILAENNHIDPDEMKVIENFKASLTNSQVL